MEISVRSAVPPGCGTGTLGGRVRRLAGRLAALRSERPSPRDIAYAAHRLEVDTLGIQSGIQDQLCAALGGINYIEVEPYPEAVVHALPPAGRGSTPDCRSSSSGGPTTPPICTARSSHGLGRRAADGVLPAAGCGDRGT